MRSELLELDYWSLYVAAFIKGDRYEENRFFLFSISFEPIQFSKEKGEGFFVVRLVNAHTLGAPFHLS